MRRSTSVAPFLTKINLQMPLQESLYILNMAPSKLAKNKKV